MIKKIINNLNPAYLLRKDTKSSESPRTVLAAIELMMYSAGISEGLNQIGVTKDFLPGFVGIYILLSGIASANAGREQIAEKLKSGLGPVYRKSLEVKDFLSKKLGIKRQTDLIANLYSNSIE
jgi:hypothetical protein